MRSDPSRISAGGRRTRDQDEDDRSDSNEDDDGGVVDSITDGASDAADAVADAPDRARDAVDNAVDEVQDRSSQESEGDDGSSDASSADDGTENSRDGIADEARDRVSDAAENFRDRAVEAARESDADEQPTARERLIGGAREVASDADRALGTAVGSGAATIGTTTDVVENAIEATPFADQSTTPGPRSPTAQAVTGDDREPLAAIDDARREFADDLGLDPNDVSADYDEDEGTVEVGVAPETQVEQLEEQILDERGELEDDDIDFSVDEGEVTAELPPEFDSDLPIVGDRVEQFRAGQYRRGQAIDDVRSDLFGVDALEDFETSGTGLPSREEAAAGGAVATATPEPVSTAAGVGVLGAVGIASGVEATRQAGQEEGETRSINEQREIKVPEDPAVGQSEIDVGDQPLTEQLSELGVPTDGGTFSEIDAPEQLQEDAELGVPTGGGTSIGIIDTQQQIGDERLIERQGQREVVEDDETTVIGEEDLVDPDELRRQEMEELREQVEGMAEFTESPSDRFQEEQDAFESFEDAETDRIMDEAANESAAERSNRQSETEVGSGQQPAQDIVPGSDLLDDQVPGQRQVEDVATDVGVRVDQVLRDVAIAEQTNRTTAESDGLVEQQALPNGTLLQQATETSGRRDGFRLGLPELGDGGMGDASDIGVDIDDIGIERELDDPDFLGGGQR